MTSLYLGLDSSTQSLTGVVLEVDGTAKRVVFRESLNFDATFPQYGTRDGILPQTDPRVARSSPLLWADALDAFFHTLAATSALDLERLRAVSGAAQQHGSVYCNKAARTMLGALDPAQPLATQIRPLLSLADAPIWMDSSTDAECAAITRALGGDDGVRRLTGSRATERFTGPQIRKFHRGDPQSYAATDRIHLVSSFLASLLIGGHSPIDYGDGSGMNLMDLRARQWSREALDASAPGLEAKLPDLCPAQTVIGRLAPYWTERHGLPAASVVAWTGDNLSSAVGVGLVSGDSAAISLGTSDTVFGLLPQGADLTDASHVFVSPTGDDLALVCFQNGALARERVRHAYGLSWSEFSAMLRSTPAGNDGRMMLPWFEPEITPAVRTPGVRRFGLDESDAAGNVRAVVEAQMLATGLHAGWMVQGRQRIYATGGAASNREILHVMADVHGMDVYGLESTDTAALGAALRAWHADRAAAGQPVSWKEVVAGIAEPTAEGRVRPIPANVAVYKRLKSQYAEREAEVLARG